MNTKTSWLIIVVLVFTLFLSPWIARGDGFIVPIPHVNISVKYHHVNVDIDNQVAHTEIDQVFINDSDINNFEAIYIFPLPKGVALSHFSMFVDDQELVAEVLDADSAAAYYESIVRKNIDPALLEYLGQGLFRARIFPFNAFEEKRIKMSYTEVIEYDSDIYRYLYPLNTEKFSARPLEDVSVNVNLTSSNPIKTIYSPSHPIVVQKQDDYHATISYSEQHVKPNIDFVLYYTVSSDDIGLHLLSHNPPDEDGFYMFMAAPKIEISDTEIVRKRLLFVLDRSGSMSGQKIDQAKEALRFCVNSLNPNDFFNIVDFSSTINQFKFEPVAANETNIGEALNYIDSFIANGGTNINEALLTALQQMAHDELANMIIFLTDGQPTVGVTENQQIRQNVNSANTVGARLFTFGVGYDVNSTLLDNLTLDNHGVSTYVRPEENIEVAVSTFFNKINTPVLSNIAVDYGGIHVYDSFPQEFPDLFKGSQLLVLGRYKTSGTTTINLTGVVNDVQKSFELDTEFPAENPGNDFLPRLWATRKIGYLLDIIRLNGENQEVIDEIIALSKKYGIITPYTSFLIVEDTPLADNWQDLSEETGGIAFDNAVNNGRYRNADNTQLVTSGQVRYAGNKTFYLREGFWVDSQLEEQANVIDVEFASEPYFELLKEYNELAPYFAVDRNVIINVNDTNYRIYDVSQDISATPPETPILVLAQNYPNPFNAATTIEFKLREPSLTSLVIYDINGKKVRLLVNKTLQLGQYRMQWDGLDDNGIMVASGLYFYKVQTAYSTSTKKLIYLR